MEIQTKDWHAVAEQTTEGQKITVSGKVVVPTSSTTVTLVQYDLSNDGDGDGVDDGPGGRYFDTSLQLDLVLRDNDIGAQVLTEKTVNFSIDNWQGISLVRIQFKGEYIAHFDAEQKR